MSRKPETTSSSTANRRGPSANSRTPKAETGRKMSNNETERTKTSDTERQHPKVPALSTEAMQRVGEPAAALSSSGGEIKKTPASDDSNVPPPPHSDSDIPALADAPEAKQETAGARSSSKKRKIIVMDAKGTKSYADPSQAPAPPPRPKAIPKQRRAPSSNSGSKAKFSTSNAPAVAPMKAVSKDPAASFQSTPKTVAGSSKSKKTTTGGGSNKPIASGLVSSPTATKGNANQKKKPPVREAAMSSDDEGSKSLSQLPKSAIRAAGPKVRKVKDYSTMRSASVATEDSHHSDASNDVDGFKKYRPKPINKQKLADRRGVSERRVKHSPQEIERDNEDEELVEEELSPEYPGGEETMLEGGGYGEEQEEGENEFSPDPQNYRSAAPPPMDQGTPNYYSKELEPPTPIAPGAAGGGVFPLCCSLPHPVDVVIPHPGDHRWVLAAERRRVSDASTDTVPVIVVRDSIQGAELYTVFQDDETEPQGEQELHCTGMIVCQSTSASAITSMQRDASEDHASTPPPSSVQMILWSGWSDGSLKLFAYRPANHGQPESFDMIPDISFATRPQDESSMWVEDSSSAFSPNYSLKEESTSIPPPSAVHHMNAETQQQTELSAVCAMCVVPSHLREDFGELLVAYRSGLVAVWSSRRARATSGPHLVLKRSHIVSMDISGSDGLLGAVRADGVVMQWRLSAARGTATEIASSAADSRYPSQPGCGGTVAVFAHFGRYGAVGSHVLGVEATRGSTTTQLWTASTDGTIEIWEKVRQAPHSGDASSSASGVKPKASRHVLQCVRRLQNHDHPIVTMLVVKHAVMGPEAAVPTDLGQPRTAHAQAPTPTQAVVSIDTTGLTTLWIQSSPGAFEPHQAFLRVGDNSVAEGAEGSDSVPIITSAAHAAMVAGQVLWVSGPKSMHGWFLPRLDSKNPVAVSTPGSGTAQRHAQHRSALSASRPNETNDELEMLVDLLRAEVEEKDKRINSLEEENGELSQDVDIRKVVAMENTIMSVNNQLSEAEGTIDRLKDELASEKKRKASSASRTTTTLSSRPSGKQLKPGGNDIGRSPNSTKQPPLEESNSGEVPAALYKQTKARLEQALADAADMKSKFITEQAQVAELVTKLSDLEQERGRRSSGAEGDENEADEPGIPIEVLQQLRDQYKALAGRTLEIRQEKVDLEQSVDELKLEFVESKKMMEHWRQKFLALEADHNEMAREHGELVVMWNESKLREEELQAAGATSVGGGNVKPPSAVKARETSPTSAGGEQEMPVLKVGSPRSKAMREKQELRDAKNKTDLLEAELRKAKDVFAAQKSALELQANVAKKAQTDAEGKQRSRAAAMVDLRNLSAIHQTKLRDQETKIKELEELNGLLHQQLSAGGGSLPSSRQQPPLSGQSPPAQSTPKGNKTPRSARAAMQRVPPSISTGGTPRFSDPADPPSPATASSTPLVSRGAGAVRELWWQMHHHRLVVDFQEYYQRSQIVQLAQRLLAERREDEVKDMWVQDCDENDRLLENSKKVIRSLAAQLERVHTPRATGVDTHSTRGQVFPLPLHGGNKHQQAHHKKQTSGNGSPEALRNLDDVRRRRRDELDTLLHQITSAQNSPGVSMSRGNRVPLRNASGGRDISPAGSARGGSPPVATGTGRQVEKVRHYYEDLIAVYEEEKIELMEWANSLQDDNEQLSGTVSQLENKAAAEVVAGGGGGSGSGAIGPTPRSARKLHAVISPRGQIPSAVGSESVQGSATPLQQFAAQLFSTDSASDAMGSRRSRGEMEEPEDAMAPRRK